MITTCNNIPFKTFKSIHIQVHIYIDEKNNPPYKALQPAKHMGHT